MTRRIRPIPPEIQNFQDMNLKGKSFKKQNLSNADFSRANLQGVNFSEAILENANFSQAKIQGANFTRATLIDAKFISAKGGIEQYWSIIFIFLLGSFSILSGAISALIGALLFGLESHLHSLSVGAGLLMAVIITTLLIATKKQGISRGISLAIGEAAFFGLIAGLIATMGYPEVARITLVAISYIIIAVAVISALIFIYTPIISIVGMRWVPVAPTFAILEVASIFQFGKGDIGKSLRAGGWQVAIFTCIVAIVITLVCIQISYGAFKGHPKNAVVKRFALAVTTALGTRFFEADLTNADFSRASLGNTDFRIKTPQEDIRSTKQDHTQWYQASGLDDVRWGDSILQDPRVRDLLVTRTGRNKFYDDADLQRADLSGFDFDQATLTGANLMGANLQGACLEGANLKLVKALNTDFRRSQMTAATIEAWSIDRLTRLEEVDCKFVYLSESSLTGERLKSPASGEFEPGNFTEMFQVTLNTLDLILQEGVVGSALEEALKAIQNQHGEIRLKAIDRRGDGLFVFTVIVPEGADKEEIDRNFHQVYHATVSALEAQYSNQLREVQQEVDIAKRRAVIAEAKLEAKLYELTDLAGRLNKLLGSPGRYQPACKSVFLDFGIDDPESEGLTVRALLLSRDNSSRPIKAHGALPPAPDLFQCYTRWKDVHDIFYGINQDSPSQHISRQELNSLASNVSSELNQWLRSDDFRKISDWLFAHLDPEEEIHFFLQTESLKLRSLPWHLWDFFKTYRNASWTIGMSETQKVLEESSRERMRVLAVLGNSDEIDVETDRHKLQELIHSKGDLEFLNNPSRRRFTEYLWNSPGWDIFYFSGHSNSNSTKTLGSIQINQTDAITFNELQETLSTAIQNGLQLAIFNCCDGLGLARTLEERYLPHIIVMKQEIADEVAQAFLENFISELIERKSIYTAFRAAREQLEALEDIYPCATWLPTLLANSAESPFYWKEETS